jgi:conjugative transfer signal peptidase TraF
MRRRRLALRQGKSRAIWSAMAGAAASALILNLPGKPVPRLVWNTSESSPPGLYWLTPQGPARRGEMVVAWPPAKALRLAEQRHYLPGGIPLVKPVAAASGDQVCAAGPAVSVNGRLAALRRRRDARGRPLPWWSGCLALKPGQLLLLGTAPDSFDGRYFGITQPDDVVAPARLVWAR